MGPVKQTRAFRLVIEKTRDAATMLSILTHLKKSANSAIAPSPGELS